VRDAYNHILDSWKTSKKAYANDSGWDTLQERLTTMEERDLLSSEIGAFLSQVAKEYAGLVGDKK